MPVAGYGAIDNTKYLRHEWQALGEGDTGRPMGGGKLADKTVQVDGTFDGATVALEGSMDGVNWATLSDSDGDPVSTTTTGYMAMIVENPRFIRPNVTGGGASTDIDVTIGASALTA
jgi:hypothetical protein